MAIKLILVRHGETDWNIQQRYQGHTDINLNETGINQAKRLARELKSEKIDAIYSSDLTRAVQTAAIINDGRNLPIHQLWELRECSFGIWEGKTFKEMEQHFPEEVARIKGDPVKQIRTGGESRDQLSTRIGQAIQQIIDTHQNQSVLIVAHGGALAVAMEYITGEGLIARSKYWLENAGYHILECNNRNCNIIHCGTPVEKKKPEVRGQKSEKNRR
ncbi:MAG: histidine phosphatase family protein [bacterium]